VSYNHPSRKMATELKFSDLEPALSSESLAAVASFGFTCMTPVQASSIPYFLKNKDVCVEATTGSGKTLAFGLPIFEILKRSVPETTEISKHDVFALIMAPTRELASQIHEVINKISQFHPRFKSVLFVGGTHITESCTAFEEHGGHIVIGTPGRILDVKNRITNVLTFKKLEVLVLDEADTLLDMGFRDTISQLLAFLPKQRRTGLFSATQTKEVRELARAGMRNPVSISVRVQTRPNANNDQNSDLVTRNNNAETPALPTLQQATPSTLDNCYMVCEYDQRPDEILNFLRTHLDKKIIVFCATCACVDYYSNVFEQIAKKGKLLPDTLAVLGFHGRMVPKKRTALYRKFVKLSSGVMFSTDVAARGVDIPDVDWIVQLAAPKDPAFFVHRVGRTARAGRTGGALLFVTSEEQSYVDLLRGRGVPLRERERTTALNDGDNLIETNSGPATCGSALLKAMKTLAMTDRTVLEAGSHAFMSFLRAYKEHMCCYIFRFEQLDIGAIARSYALLRLPKIPETRGVKGKPIEFEITNIDTSTVPYLHKEQEEARLRRLKEAYEAAEEEDKKAQSEARERKNSAKAAKQTAAEGESDGEGDSDAENADLEPTTRKFTPHEVFLQKDDKKDRKRKQKGGLHKKIMDEWDDLAAEEMAYKKFKKGLISQKEYDQCLMSDKKLALDPVTGEPMLGYESSDMEGEAESESDSDNDSDVSDVSGSEDGAKKKKQGKKSDPKGRKMVLKYREADSSDEEDATPGKSKNNKHGNATGKTASGKAFSKAGQSGKGSNDYRRVKSGNLFPGAAALGKAKQKSGRGAAKGGSLGGRGGSGKGGGGGGKKGGKGRR